jgi:hypothetical protein
MRNVFASARYVDRSLCTRRLNSAAEASAAFLKSPNISITQKASTPLARRIVRYERIGRRHVAFPDNAFANPQGLVRSIAEQAGFAKVRRGMKIVFRRDFSAIAERLDGMWQILPTLAFIALKKTAVRGASALSDQVESPDRKEFAPIQKLGKHVLVGKAGPLFRDML